MKRLLVAVFLIPWAPFTLGQTKAGFQELTTAETQAFVRIKEASVYQQRPSPRIWQYLPKSSPPSRYEAALNLISSVQIAKDLVYSVEACNSTFRQANLRQVQILLDDQLELIKALPTEIKELEADPIELETQLRELAPRIELQAKWQAPKETQASLKLNDAEVAAYDRLTHSVAYAGKMGYPNDSWFHWRPPTRYEAAVELHASIVRALKVAQRRPGAAPFTTSELLAVRDVLPDQEVLVNAFRKELSDLGLDRRSLLRGLKRAEGQLASLEEHRAPAWTEETLKQMRQDGILVGYPDTICGTRPPTRYELAVATHATYLRVRRMLNYLETDPTKSRFETAIEISKTARYLEPLSRLRSEFERELANLGVPYLAMADDLRALNRLENRQWDPEHVVGWFRS